MASKSDTVDTAPVILHQHPTDEGLLANVTTSSSPSVFEAKNEDDKKSTEESSSPAVEPEWASGFKLLTISVAVTLVAFLMLLDTSILVTAIPRITSDFHSLADVGWYGSAYQLSCAALQPLTGQLYVNLSSKWTFMGFFLIFELGSLICALSVSSTMLIIGRAVAGIGTSGILNGVFTILSGCVAPAKRATIVGIVIGIAQIGLAAGPLIGGALTEYTSWRWCFWINLPIGAVVAMMLAFTTIPEAVAKPEFWTAVKSLPGKLDLVGFALFAPSTILLLLALQYGGNQYAWNSAEVIGLFCGAGGCFAVFLFWNYRKGDSAMIPLSIIRQRAVWASCISYGLMLGQIACSAYYLPIYFQGIKGASPLYSGIYVLPSILGHVVMAMISGKIIQMVGYYLPIILTSAALVAVANGLFSTLGPDTSTAAWAGYQVLHGLARGFGIQVPIVVVQNLLEAPLIPVATALVTFSQTFAGAMFLSFAATIFTNSLNTLIPEYAPSVSPQQVISAGATGFRSAISDTEMTGLLIAYSKSIDRVFYLATGMAVGCFIASCAMGWKNINKKPEDNKEKV